MKEKGHWKKRARKISIDMESNELKGKEGSYLTGSKKLREGVENRDDLNGREEIEKKRAN